MSVICQNCKTSHANVKYHNYDLCSSCTSRIGVKVPQIKPEKDPKSIILEAKALKLTQFAQAQKLFAEHGYFYKCPFCYFVSVDLETICMSCKAGKKIDKYSLKKEMPLGWA